MRFLRQGLMGLFLLSVTLGLLVYAGNLVRESVSERMARESRAPQQRERVFAVNVVPAQPGTETPVLTVFGEIQSRRTLDLRAPAAGTIQFLDENMEEGGQVAEGQLLMQIDPADAELGLRRVQNDLLDAEAEGRDAQRALVLAQDELASAEEQAALRDSAFQRARDLQLRGVGTAAAVESAELVAASARQSVLSRRQALAQAETRIDSAATRTERAKIAVSEAERRLADTRIEAGFSGTISEIAVVQGGLVSTNERIAKLIDNTALEVAFRVSTQQYARLLGENGALQSSPVSVTLDVFGVDIEATGRITRDSGAVGDGQTGRLIFARLDTAPGFKPGDFVTVEVEEPPLRFATRLPATALAADNTVLVVGEGERLRPVEVQLLRRQGDDVLVRSRDLVEQLVVAQRTPLLGAGIRVRPLQPGEAQEAPPPPAMVELTDERRAKLIAFVEANNRMPAQVRQRLLGQLNEPEVPAQVVERLESRMGG